MASAKKNRISILNWMGTLLLCAIPGVNIIATICFLIFAKSPSKRTFAWAMFIWMILLAVTGAVLLILLPEQAANLAATLREAAGVAPTPVPAP